MGPGVSRDGVEGQCPLPSDNRWPYKAVPGSCKLAEPGRVAIHVRSRLYSCHKAQSTHRGVS